MNAQYAAPVDDLLFALDVVDAWSLGDDERFRHFRRDECGVLLGEFGRFCEDVVAPLHAVGDRCGATYDPASGAVETPVGWREAYAKFVDAGWSAASAAERWGGGGLPWTLSIAMQEMLNASNIAFALCPMLTSSAVHMLELHGSPAQQAMYLPNLVTGEWTGTMNLTEPDAGSDVGALRTRAERDTHGSWSVTGRKIFITYGEHDLTDQIVHLVLARTPGAPPGTRGISCFIVPKVLADGTRNRVRCAGIEEKMGLHASPTCTLEFDGATAELIGAENAGMPYMFTMMNLARLSVGVQGVGVASRAHQAALAYARARVQGSVPGRPAGSSIVEHPDIRRTLIHMRSNVEAMRLLVLLNAKAIDERDFELAEVLTPLSKAWCTDTALEVARLATQVHGGSGYIREVGVEQFERDIRIASIYEGTNGIQAVDLITRKLGLRGGNAVLDLLARIGGAADRLNGELAPVGADLRRGVAAATAATRWLVRAGACDRRAALAGATPYLHLLATVVAAWLLAAQADRAQRHGTDEVAAAKRAVARYFVAQVLPVATGLLPAITAGARDMDAIDAALL